MTQLYRIVKFKNKHQTADTLPSMKHPTLNKPMLFTSYEKARAFIIELEGSKSLMSRFPQEFEGTVSARYVVDPDAPRQQTEQTNHE